MKKIFWLVVISLCLSFWFSSSGMAVKPIKIAVIFAKTGVAATTAYEYDAVNLVVEQINKQGGILGRPIKVIEFDNKSTALGAKEAALEAIKLNVTAVIGSGWSSHSLAIAPVLQEAGIPMVTPMSTNPKVTQIGDYIFRTCFTDPFQGKVMAYFALEDLKAKTGVILINTNQDYSMGLSESFKKSFIQRGGKILWEGKYAEKETDFASILKEVKTLQPNVIFIPGYNRDSGFIMKQARSMGIKAIFLGGDALNDDIYKFGGDSVEGAYISQHWHNDVTSAKSTQLQIDFKRRYGKDLLSYVPLVNDAALVLFDAITRAGSLNRKKIRDALAATKNFQGTTGIITFDEYRDPLNKDAVILKFEKGKSVFIKSIKPE